MRAESLAALAQVEGLEVVVPRLAPDGESVSPEMGYTPHGIVQGLDEAEAVAEYFRSQRVDGLILCSLDFGDERSPSKIAERLQAPVLLYATKEPAALDDPAPRDAQQTAGVALRQRAGMSGQGSGQDLPSCVP